MIIVGLNLIYIRVAIRMNNFENHRTDTQYEDFLISKIFLFQVRDACCVGYWLLFIGGWC